MNKVSILGSGWLGKALAMSLSKKGFLIKGSTTSIHKVKELKRIGIAPYIVDLTSQVIEDDFLASKILIIAITSKSEDDFKRFISKIEQSPIEKVVFVSSTSVYARINKIMTEEDKTVESPLVRIEKLFRQNKSFKTTIIRFAGLFDADRHPSNWFKNGRKIPQPKGFVNMIHKEDCIAVIEQIIKQEKWDTIFNACSNHHPTRKEFYENAKKSRGLSLPVFEENEIYKWKIISSKKVQLVLNYKFKYDDLLDI